MQRIARLSKKFFLSYRALPQKKQYLEFFTALLSIPMLITVIILNYNNLNTLNKNKVTPTPLPEKIYVTIPGSSAVQEEAPVQTTEACKKELGPVSISSPEEKETITDNPVSVDISYDDTTYCGAVWSYRINGGDWSDYDDKSIALYNLPQGDIKFELRVKSIVTKDDDKLTRNFVYKGKSTGSPSASSSAN
jgi:hypothetical protein